MELKNYCLEVIGKVLNYPMTFQNGRVKMRFLKLLTPHEDIVQKSRSEMLSTLADKDEKTGVAIMDTIQTPNGPAQQYRLSPESLKTFSDEYAKLMEETMIVEITDAVRAELGLVRMFINNSPVSLDNRETLVMDEVITALEVEAAKK